VEALEQDGLRLAPLVDRVVAAERGAVLELELLDKEIMVERAEEAQAIIHTLVEAVALVILPVAQVEIMVFQHLQQLPVVVVMEA
jgi:hypothetical protein